jgi:hypothetical protein
MALVDTLWESYEDPSFNPDTGDYDPLSLAYRSYTMENDDIITEFTREPPRSSWFDGNSTRKNSQPQQGTTREYPFESRASARFGSYYQRKHTVVIKHRRSCKNRKLPCRCRNEFMTSIN